MGLITLFKAAVAGQRFRPADFNQNMTDIENAVNGLDTSRVKNTTDETIAGVKTFSSPPVVPTPSGATDAANKGYVDGYAAPVGHVGSGGGAHANAVAGGAAGFMTGADKTKLDGVGAGAEANQNAFAQINVTGQPSLTADTESQAYEIYPGVNITITVDNVSKRITINATGEIGTTADQVALTDAAGLLTANEVEAAFAEILGAGRTTETLKGLADLIALRATLASPTFTGTPAAPTAAKNTDTTQLATMAAVQAQVRESDLDTTQTDSFTLALDQKGQTVLCSAATTITVTVPPNSSVAFPVGSQIQLVRYSTGAVTVAAGSGVTILSSDSKLSINKTYESAVLQKTATDTWVLIGALV